MPDMAYCVVSGNPTAVTNEIKTMYKAVLILTPCSVPPSDWFAPLRLAYTTVVRIHQHKCSIMYLFTKSNNLLITHRVKLLYLNSYSF